MVSKGGTPFSAWEPPVEGGYLLTCCHSFRGEGPPKITRKLLPSVYQISSGLVRGSSDNPSQCFGQWAKVSRQECKERACGGMQEGNWVKNFISYNQASIFHQHYLIPKDPLIRHP